MKKKVRTSLVIMAAGIGSRFGQGIKQLTSFGPSGEIIMDYSIYDALRAGFDRIVFVIRKDLEKDFREVIGDRIAKHAEVAYVFQEMDALPDGYSVPEGRKKPWGTGQAILACRGVVQEPFCVINADDYYGQEAFRTVHDWLVEHAVVDGAEAQADGGISVDAGTPMQMCMAGFLLRNTLSENGGVTRGVCSVGPDGRLATICETKNLVRNGDGAGIAQPDGTVTSLDPETPVSMNLWGFCPAFLDVLEDGFRDFLKGYIGSAEETKAEYLLPSVVGELIENGNATVEVLPTRDKWFGVTYHEDIDGVKQSLAQLVEKGIYPAKLWT